MTFYYDNTFSSIDRVVNTARAESALQSGIRGGEGTEEGGGPEEGK